MNLLVKISRCVDHFRWEQVCQSCGAHLSPQVTAAAASGPAPCASCGGRLVVDVLKVATLRRGRPQKDDDRAAIAPDGPSH